MTDAHTTSPRVFVTDEVGPVAGELLATAIAKVVAARGRCRLALSGGTAPIPVLQWLAEHLPRSLVGALVVTWIDERHLPLPPHDRATHDWRALPAESNLRLAWEHWLSKLPTPPALLPMARPERLEEAARRYGEEFSATLGGLDVALLGVGPDGHIASLFPDHPALQATGVCVAVPDSPKPPPQRLTLTLAVLESLEHAVLVATGAAKAPVLRRALAGDASIPLGRYRPRGAWSWVVDPAAAAELPLSSAQESS
jgi:6-phosphogluconolactonase